MQGLSKIHRQGGNTIWTMMILVAVAGFLLTILFKLMPAYINNYDVKSVLDALLAEQELGSMSNGEVRRVLERRFDINRVDAIRANCSANDKNKIPCISIERTKEVLIIDANYEKRIPVMANVDAVVKFENNRVEIPLKGG